MLAAAACSKPADKPAADTTAMAPAATKPEPMAFVTVIYNQPKSASRLREVLLGVSHPLVGAKQAEVGFVGAELTKFDATLDGKKPTYYRQAVLWFKNMADLEKGIATPGFKAIGDDLANFATGGLIALVGEETGDHSDLLQGDSTAFVTVILQQSQGSGCVRVLLLGDPPSLVGQGAAEIGFTKGRTHQVQQEPGWLGTLACTARPSCTSRTRCAQEGHRNRGIQGGGRRSAQVRRRGIGGLGGASDQ
jgi:uncharacterized protein (TIGR02118 family)